jgi:hypothetical protein
MAADALERFLGDRSGDAPRASRAQDWERRPRAEEFARLNGALAGYANTVSSFRLLRDTMAANTELEYSIAGYRCQLPTVVTSRFTAVDFGGQRQQHTTRLAIAIIDVPSRPVAAYRQEGYGPLSEDEDPSSFTATIEVSGPRGSDVILVGAGAFDSRQDTLLAKILSHPDLDESRKFADDFRALSIWNAERCNILSASLESHARQGNGRLQQYVTAMIDPVLNPESFIIVGNELRAPLGLPLLGEVIPATGNKPTAV